MLSINSNTKNNSSFCLRYGGKEAHRKDWQAQLKLKNKSLSKKKLFPLLGKIKKTQFRRVTIVLPGLSA